ncbi:enoyl-CoA hydratase [Janibacter sp. Soil728]|uniref:enoyl-CoA hydratase/isomerase family protein n=1 Tax=Janibacter sp. Soil728 TaxID=1736393 RepID=UPI0007008A6A|nr:enoyl-CoA hydratase-related protein [Janibacter sp. Soil728]KRE39378.1 enoyl-CoA hydratase [Janibacter sp. Soil728]
MTDATSIPSGAEGEVLLDTVNGVATITLNRPTRKNAMTTASWMRLGEIVRAVREDEAVRAIVLTGAGKDFCSGADLAGPPDPRHPLTRMNGFSDIAVTLYEMPKPVIARIDGIAAGAGCNLALGCDFVVATPRSRFSEIFVRRGLSLDFGGAWLLPRIVGLQQAKRLALLGEIIDAAEAERIGMVTWVRDEDEIDACVADLASRLAAGPPTAMALNKLMLHEGTNQNLREALDSEARSQLINFATDAPAAKQAFLDKTDPVFEGRWRL